MNLKKCWAVSLLSALSTAQNAKLPDVNRYQALMKAAGQARGQHDARLISVAKSLVDHPSYLLRSGSLRVLALEGDVMTVRKRVHNDRAQLLRAEALEYLLGPLRSPPSAKDLLEIAERSHNREWPALVSKKAVAALGKMDLSIPEQRRYSALVRSLDPLSRSRAARTPALKK